MIAEEFAPVCGAEWFGPSHRPSLSKRGDSPRRAAPRAFPWCGGGAALEAGGNLAAAVRVGPRVDELPPSIEQSASPRKRLDASCFPHAVGWMLRA